ncbi:hypothetical protein EVAR_46742_1 [Eumeta japonica]|uniref:Uncharacterized protein n=1 Tax=Eumeta variegata TaxID=151549 RepID=A0A4C2ACF6_EUMVA|nr:hypothetical protein EVAR_46742_1 [Eumeta japonica]
MTSGRAEQKAAARNLGERRARSRSLRAGVLGHGLRTFADCVLRQLAGQQTDRGLHLPSMLSSNVCCKREARRFGGYTLEYVVHERVHDRHGLARYTGVRMDP